MDTFCLEQPPSPFELLFLYGDKQTGPFLFTYCTQQTQTDPECNWNKRRRKTALNTNKREIYIYLTLNTRNAWTTALANNSFINTSVFFFFSNFISKSLIDKPMRNDHYHYESLLNVLKLHYIYRTNEWINRKEIFIFTFNIYLLFSSFKYIAM